MAFITKAEVKRLIQESPAKNPEDILSELIDAGNQIEGMMFRGLEGPIGPQGPQGAAGPVGPQGAQGLQGSKGDDGRDGRDGRDGSDGATGAQGPKGDKGDKGEKGADGTNTVVHVNGGGGGGGGGLELVRANGVIVKQGVSQIDFGTNLTVTTTLNGVRVTGSAGGGSGATLTAETPTGTVDDSNLTFSVGNTPVFLTINGLVYSVGTGIFASYAGGTITLNSPVGTGGFIISFYNA